ncbi:10031_t:CDS:2, partial [Ambispora leptoticha]
MSISTSASSLQQKNFDEFEDDREEILTIKSSLSSSNNNSRRSSNNSYCVQDVISYHHQQSASLSQSHTDNDKNINQIRSNSLTRKAATTIAAKDSYHYNELIKSSQHRSCNNTNNFTGSNRTTKSPLRLTLVESVSATVVGSEE